MNDDWKVTLNAVYYNMPNNCYVVIYIGYV